MENRIRTGDPRGFNKERSSKFREGSRVRQTPEEMEIRMKTIVRKRLMIKILLWSYINPQYIFLHSQYCVHLQTEPLKV